MKVKDQSQHSMEGMKYTMQIYVRIISFIVKNKHLITIHGMVLEFSHLNCHFKFVEGRDFKVACNDFYKAK
jgi:hypothetical protein